MEYQAIQAIPSSIIKYHAIPYTIIQYHLNPVFSPRCYIHLRWSFFLYLYICGSILWVMKVRFPIEKVLRKVDILSSALLTSVLCLPDKDPNPIHLSSNTHSTTMQHPSQRVLFFYLFRLKSLNIISEFHIFPPRQLFKILDLSENCVTNIACKKKTIMFGEIHNT